jgi:multiple sugar transport system permease protein
MTGGGPAMRTELTWTTIARIGYKDANMGMANAMSYLSIILSIAFTYYFFTKLKASRQELGQ